MGKDSVYYDYVSSLPTNLDNFPAKWSEKEQEYMKDCHTSQYKILSRKQTDANDYVNMCKAVPEMKDKISFDEFITGKIWASTRAYDLAFTDGEVRQVLIPYLEYAAINHKDE